jgi:hypothetical protein
MTISYLPGLAVNDGDVAGVGGEPGVDVAAELWDDGEVGGIVVHERVVRYRTRFEL